MPEPIAVFIAAHGLLFTILIARRVFYRFVV